MTEKLYGYNGKVAFINLSDKSVEIKDLEPKVAKEYLGGTGLSAIITYDLLSKDDYTLLKSDPLAEINPLIFATGPVTGTNRPSSGRYSVTGISPATGMWGEGTSGGYFCLSLRNSGYDAIVFSGKSRDPVYIYINDGKIEFKDASNLWGKDCYESQDLIKKEIDQTNLRIACIGQGGENLVKYGAIINDEGRAVGRCGLGTLMGSKNLKALAIHGSKRIEISDKELGKELRKQEELAKQGDPMANIGPQLFNLYGTNFYLDLGMVNGDTPGYYFTEAEFLAEKLTSKTLKEEYPMFSYGCAGCTMKCGKATVIEVNGEEIEVDGPEYESVAALGTLCGLFDSKQVILANHLCNKFGIDTISCGVSIAFLIYLVQNNLGIEKIKPYLTDFRIEDITWGNGEFVLGSIEKIIKREGIGNILAEGVKIMAEKFEVDPELAAHVKGLEIPMHDPRAFAGQALSYMTCCVGADHNKGDWYGAELGNTNYPSIKVRRSKGRNNIKGSEKGVANLQDLRAIDDSAVNCNMVHLTFESIIGYINAATGFNYDKKSLMEVGERINNLKRVISCNLGITREDDKLPGHIAKTLPSGRIMGVKLDLEDNLKKYYTRRGWDWDTGRPTEEKLRQLNILK
ncbi:MAG: aldehyde ferredoxin oxidoreductase family protein [Candidatus Lokiarchaeota archaeon]|nr:aldehyde ferredoxin oxidoreductase family protein [Candidatus Lokiarchaeota archaeon]